MTRTRCDWTGLIFTADQTDPQAGILLSLCALGSVSALHTPDDYPVLAEDGMRGSAVLAQAPAVSLLEDLHHRQRGGEFLRDFGLRLGADLELCQCAQLRVAFQRFICHRRIEPL